MNHRTLYGPIPGTAQRASRSGTWVRLVLVIAFVFAVMPGGHAMSGADSPLQSAMMADCETCTSEAAGAAPCTASLVHLPVAPVATVPGPAATSADAPITSTDAFYRAPDLEGPRHPPRRA